jgi:SAM-dependent methyltransferase
MDRQDSDFIHKEFSKQFSKDDFWSQIKRTVDGKPVSEDDINMIISQITSNLDLTPDSHLLDIGCGNGALAARLFPYLNHYTGVDFSTVLLEVANEYFKPNNHINYIEDDAVHFVSTYPDTKGIDKLLVYGCISYLSHSDLEAFLQCVAARFGDLRTAFIGNIPDVHKAAEFFKKRDIKDYETGNENTPIGLWWRPDELIQIANSSGFNASALKMPDTFYGHHYRFDLVLKRSSDQT